MPIVIGERYGKLRNLKEAILVLCAVYFYSVAFALQTGRPTYHAEHPLVFLCVFTLFLLAMGLEMVLEWGNKLQVGVWALLFLASYGVIGFFVVPLVLGPQAMLYVFLEPLIIVFFGGFIYAYATLFTRSLFFSSRISRQEISRALDFLPGWVEGVFLEKTFRFADFSQALNFVNRCSQKVLHESSAPGFSIRFSEVTVRFRPHPLRGLSRPQLELAKELERLA